MSDKSTKRPAHWVILRKLEDRMIQLGSLSTVRAMIPHRLRILEVVFALRDVLCEITIPKKELKGVLRYLRELAPRWRTNVDGHNVIEELCITLSREQ